MAIAKGEITIAVVYDGQVGEQGPQGISITAVSVEYASSTSKTTAPITGWSTTAPSWQAGTYIWQRIKTTYSEGSPTYTLPQCIDTAAIDVIHDTVTTNTNDITALGMLITERTTVGGELISEAITELQAGQISLRIEAGGQNLLLGTTNEIASTSLPNTEVNAPLFSGSVSDDIPVGTALTISLLVRQSTNVQAAMRFVWEGDSWVTLWSGPVLQGEDFHRVSITTAVPADTRDFSISLVNLVPGVSDIDYHSLNMVLGSEVRPWKPNSLDLQQGRTFTEASIAVIEGALVTKVDESTYQEGRADLIDQITGKADQLDLQNVVETQATMLQTQSQWAVVVQAVQDLTNSHDITVKDVLNYMAFGADGLTLGDTNSSLKIRIDNERISFLDGASEVAYITGQRLHITAATIVDSLQVGNHKIEKWGTSGQFTVFKYVGG